MSYLLDTHVFLWWMLDSPHLQEGARDAIGDSHNVVYVSSASAWEISIKIALGRFKMPTEDFERELSDGAFNELPISVSEGLAAGALPAHHRDPFDRMLVAQAQINKLTLITHDEALEPYGVPILWT